jgi:hypothetical protein
MHNYCIHACVAWSNPATLTYAWQALPLRHTHHVTVSCAGTWPPLQEYNSGWQPLRLPVYELALISRKGYDDPFTIRWAVGELALQRLLPNLLLPHLHMHALLHLYSLLPASSFHGGH